MKKICRNDEIVVIAGKDKGRKGTVLKILSKELLLVSGINMVKRHKKSSTTQQNSGGIIDKEAPIHISNVAIWNSETEKADRVGFDFNDEGKKYRIFKHNRKPIDL